MKIMHRRTLLIEAIIIGLFCFSQIACYQWNSNLIQPATFEDNWYLTGMDKIDGDYSQGLATDGKYWYFSHKSKLYKTTYDYKVITTNESAIPQFLIDQSYDHIGDVEYFKGKIYAPLEHRDRVNPGMCVFDTTDLSYTGEYYPMDQRDQNFAPWVAVDPQTGYFYVSEFSNVTWLNAYDSNNNFNFVEQVQLKRMITRVQGGVFYDGYLYLACDTGDRSGDNIYKVDILSGEVIRVISIQDSYELEGIEANEMDSGILHIMSETKENKNNFYHYYK